MYKSIEQLRKEGFTLAEILVYSHLRSTYNEGKEEIKRSTGDDGIIRILFYLIKVLITHYVNLPNVGLYRLYYPLPAQSLQ